MPRPTTGTLITVRIPPADLAKLDKLARRQKTTRAELIRAAVAQMIGEGS